MARPDIDLPLRSALDGAVLLGHKVTWGATGAVSSESSNSGVAATRSTTGRYSLVVDAPAQKCWLLSATHDGADSAVDVNWHEYTSFDASTRTLVVSNSPAGSETDPTSGDNTVFWLLVLTGDTGFTPDD